MRPIQKPYLATTIAVTVPNNDITANISKPTVMIILDFRPWSF